MSTARLSQYTPDMQIDLPVSGHGTAMVVGALLKKGSTSATDNGHLKILSGTTGNKHVGILQEAHATANDTDIPGTIYTLHPVDIIIPYRVVRLEFSQASADLITLTSAVTSASLTLTSLEANIETAFIYVVSGTGAGQTNYFTASGAGTATLKAAFGTNLDTTSKIIKVVPKFHELISLNTAGTKLSSQAAAGAIRCVALQTFIVQNNVEKDLNPVTDSALTKLNNLASLRFEANVALVDSIVYQVT